MTTSDRDEVRMQLEQLLEALLGLGDAPPELDRDAINACRLSLKQKRARVLIRLSGQGGSTCDAVASIEMELYFRCYPGCHPKGGHADLKRYKRFLAVRRLKKIVGL